MNKRKKIGTEIEIKIRPEYHKRFDTEILKRHLVRAYHLHNNLDIIVNDETLNPSKECPYGDTLLEELYIVYYVFYY